MKTFLVTCIAAATVVLTRGHRHLDGSAVGCGVGPLDESHLAEQTRLASTMSAAARTRAGNARDVCTGCVAMDLYFHVIEDVAGTSDASVKATDAALGDALALLNNQFAITPFQFNLRQISRTRNDSWYAAKVWKEPLSKEISAALRIGGSDAVNIMISDGACIGDETIPNLGGFATLPYGIELFPTNTYRADDYIFLCSDWISYSISHEVGYVQKDLLF